MEMDPADALVLYVRARTIRQLENASNAQHQMSSVKIADRVTAAPVASNPTQIELPANRALAQPIHHLEPLAMTAVLQMLSMQTARSVPRALPAQGQQKTVLNALPA
jgi:hypothetical protein